MHAIFRNSIRMSALCALIASSAHADFLGTLTDTVNKVQQTVNSTTQAVNGTTQSVGSAQQAVNNTQNAVQQVQQIPQQAIPQQQYPQQYPPQQYPQQQYPQQYPQQQAPQPQAMSQQQMPQPVIPQPVQIPPPQSQPVAAQNGAAPNAESPLMREVTSMVFAKHALEEIIKRCLQSRPGATAAELKSLDQQCQQNSVVLNRPLQDISEQYEQELTQTNHQFVQLENKELSPLQLQLMQQLNLPNSGTEADVTRAQLEQKTQQLNQNKTTAMNAIRIRYVERVEQYTRDLESGKIHY